MGYFLLNDGTSKLTLESGGSLLLALIDVSSPSEVIPLHHGLDIDTSQNYLVWALEPKTNLNWLIWGNMEPVTYASKSSAFVQPFPIAFAKRRAPTFKELSASNGAYTGQDLVWLIPAAVLTPGCPQPKPADMITDSFGTTWTVLEVAWNALKATWRAITRNLVIAHQLYDLIDIQRSQVTYDQAGGIVRTWPNSPSPAGSIVYQALPAKVQLITEDSQVVLGVSGLKGTYAVFVQSDVIIEKQDRVVWMSPNGQVYLDILGQHNPQRIDELPVLDCIVQP